MKYIYFITLLILASASLGSAQSPLGSGISSSCQTTLLGILGNQSVNACFPFSKVAPLFENANGTIPIPSTTDLTNVADAICALPKCSSDLVNSTLATFQSGCQSDLNNKVLIIQVVNFVLNFYSQTRDSICFKDSTGTYCFIDLETTVNQILQNATANQNQSPLLAFVGAPQSSVCTPCSKAIANTYFNYINSNPNVLSATQNVISSQNVTLAKGALSQKCGNSFLDGQVGDSTQNPSTFQSQNNNNKKSDATSLIASSMSLVIVLIGSILATL